MKDLINKNQNLFICILSVIAIITCVFVAIRIENQGKSDNIIIEDNNCKGNTSESKNVIKVDVRGEIVISGVYEMEEGQILNDLIEKVGGLTVNADTDYVDKSLNRASKLYDGQKVYVPAKGEFIKLDSSDNSILIDSSKININICSKTELESLPGIGPSYADRIIQGRPYKNIEDIKKINGIGESRYLQIKDLITI